MATSDMTTALVVDSPTPLAPPLVVKPHVQLICVWRWEAAACKPAEQSYRSGMHHRSNTRACSAALTTATMLPNTQDLSMLVSTSYEVSARRALSTMTLAGTLYTRSASNTLAPMPGHTRK